MVLSDRLAAHVARGHRTDTQFTFHDQTMLSDEQLLERFRSSRSSEEVALVDSDTPVRMGALAPEEGKLAPIPALPPRYRGKLDAWTDAIALMKSKPTSLPGIAPWMQHRIRAKEQAGQGGSE